MPWEIVAGAMLAIVAAMLASWIMHVPLPLSNF